MLILYIFSIKPTADFLLKPLEHKHLLDKKGGIPEKWDGKAAERIILILYEYEDK